MTNLDIFAGLFSNSSTNYLAVGEFITAMIGMLSIFVAVLGIMLAIFRESQKDAGLQRTEIKNDLNNGFSNAADERNSGFANAAQERNSLAVQIARMDAKISLLLVSKGIDFDTQEKAADKAAAEFQIQQNQEE